MKKIFIAAALMLVASQTFACEICGCSRNAGQLFGLLPWNHGHFMGVRYQYKTFTSHHLPLFDGDIAPVTSETYVTTQLWGRFNLNNKLQAYVFVPYVSYHQTGDGDAKNMKGVGDISAMLSYQLINTMDLCGLNFKQNLQAGAGIKLATGKSNITKTSDPVNENLQPGTGSYDFPLSLAYTMQYRKAGISTEAHYSINTSNKNNYRFGNSFSSSVKAFYTLPIGNKLMLLPSAGCIYENAARDFDGEDINEYAGGHTLLAAAGVDAYTRNVSFGINAEKPLQQNMGQGRIDAHARISAQVTFNF